MSEPNGHAAEPRGHVCPQCAAPRAADGTPSCPCGTRASDALRDARTAQAAAAEDFDPLRIRPYVELDGTAEKGAEAPRGAEAAAGAGEPGREARAQGQEGTGAAGEPDQRTGPDRRPAGAPTITVPMAAGTTRPDSADVRLFEEPAGPGAPTGPGTGAARHPRRKRTVFAVAGAVTAVLVTAGFVSGVFSYDTPTRDEALPDGLRASVPERSPEEEASQAAPPSDEDTASASGEPSADADDSTAGASPGTSPSSAPSASAGAASPSPSVTAEEDPAEPSPNTSATTEAPAPEADAPEEESAPQTLRRGDDGPEVTELQLRLRELDMYHGDIDENFDRGVENAVQYYQFRRGIMNDERGAYGLPTRERLEAETREP
ncbi:peptidoglycan-binding domain-containing protein [Streptomyces sp. CRN 30]|uniref:peptidoglycan-binding domain-containing protein n=1 Tax=Streptomyces sp. CRN 30 TaxID=3075613 RepID=UPI002A83B9AA|nr:peptidoglycan-binding protein [Streptomyces sp. CRN 30]